MAIETELKLRFVNVEDAIRLASHPLLAKLGAGGVEQLVATYYDTPSGDILGLGAAMRVRREGGALIQTVKTEKVNTGALHQRNEWEVEIQETGGPDLERLPDVLRTQLSEEVLGLIAPCFVTDFQRTKWLLPLAEAKDGQYVEVCLDQGEIRSGEKREPLCELELELKGGHEPAPLYEMARQFQDFIPLVPEQASKAERGYGLAFDST